jgi:hypothetical protein
MYVSPEITGNNEIISIMDTDVNDSKEDYLLNFDYLYSIETITKD